MLKQNSWFIFFVGGALSTYRPTASRVQAKKNYF